MASAKNAGLKFRTRNYKHELRLGATGDRSILNYTDEVWETLMRQVAAHDFTGIVFYAGYHPFENILDFAGMADEADQPAEHRTAVRERLNRGLQIAHEHGLLTFVHHYVGHFSRKLQEKFAIKHLGRLSNIDHPEVDRYCRSCYRAAFEQLPHLDGLYFNYESAPGNWRHVLKTAVAEFSAMDRKPIMVHRLWGFTDVEGMRQVIEAYKGRSILGHKISDTNDVYYLPCADSRVMEWKKRLGRQIEWMFLIGPCHNCGTNLCDQLWGDYGFVQALLDDARRKGADSFSFHTINEFFSLDMPEGVKVFSEHEKSLARFNRMHLQAVVDYVRGQSKTPAQRAAALAGRAGVDARAGTALRTAVEASSQLILLAYQQWCFSSAHEGYRNSGYRNHIQDPFLYNHASELSHQAKNPTWGHYRRETSWVKKTIDTPVGPENFLQYIVDYADPGRRKTTRNPKVVAGLLKKNMAVAEGSLKRYRKLAGVKAAALLEPHIRLNYQAGELARREILAGISLCKVYFAAGKSAAVSALRAGLKELKTLQALVQKMDKSTFATIRRVYMFRTGPDYSAEIAFAARALKHLAGGTYPFAAYRAYMESRRLFNEIRRIIRPGRHYDRAGLVPATELLEKSLAAAMKSVALLRREGRTDLVDNVQHWMDYLAMELAFTRPPAATIRSHPGGKFLGVHRNHGFRAGEAFTEDFLGFFEPADYRQESGLSFQLWRTNDALVMQAREEGVEMAQRLAMWEKHKADRTSISFITRLFVAVDGGEVQSFIIWPGGTGICRNKTPDVDARVEFSHTETSWQVTAAIPFDLIGRRPRAGEIWKLNVNFNPSVVGTKDYSWAPQYDGLAKELFGSVTFE